MKARLLGAVVLIAVTSLFAPQASASATDTFQVRAQTATYNASTGLVTFRIVFSDVPDFTTTDQVGRLANTFQYYIIGDASLPYPQNYDSIIRGPEINLASQLIPIRYAYPTAFPDDPSSGGWGTIRYEAPFTLHGRVLTITAPLSAVSDHTGASVSYLLETYEFGSTTDEVQGTIKLHG